MKEVQWTFESDTLCHGEYNGIGPIWQKSVILYTKAILNLQKYIYFSKVQKN